LVSLESLNNKWPCAGSILWWDVTKSNFYITPDLMSQPSKSTWFFFFKAPDFPETRTKRAQQSFQASSFYFDHSDNNAQKICSTYCACIVAHKPSS
jgi:hypothetical protein